MATKTYDPKSVSIIVKGTYITGLADSMVEISKDQDNYETKTGAQGDSVRTKVHNNVGSIKVTVQQTSPQIGFLNALANSGEMVPISVISANDPKESNSATEAFIKKQPDRKYGKDAEDREFEFVALDLKME